LLANAFKGKYTSFAKAKVLREKQTGKSRGYGFVSFLDPFEGLKALREMNGKYIGSRPVKLKKSDWKERDLKEVRKKEKAKKKFLGKLGLG
jgi:RNA recognition motif-containing protein